MGYGVALAAFHSCVVAGAASGAYEPFALAAQFHKLCLCQIHAVQGNDGLRSANNKAGRGGHTGCRGDVSGNGCVHTAEGCFVFQRKPQRGSLHIVGPVASAFQKPPLDRLCVQIIQPLFVGRDGKGLTDRECPVRVLGICVNDAEHVIFPRGSDEDRIPVNSHNIQTAAPVVDMPTHQIQSAGGSGDQHLLVSVSTDKPFQQHNIAFFLCLCCRTVNGTEQLVGPAGPDVVNKL